MLDIKELGEIQLLHMDRLLQGAERRRKYVLNFADFVICCFGLETSESIDELMEEQTVVHSRYKICFDITNGRILQNGKQIQKKALQNYILDLILRKDEN